MNACGSEPSLQHVFRAYKDLPADQLKVILQRRKVDDLKSFAKANGLKIPSRKNEIISTLINYRKIGLLEPSTSDSVDTLAEPRAPEGLNLPPFESVSSWSANSDPLPDFTFMNLYCYLVESKDKTFDMESLKAFKSLKAYKYFADGFIQNVCIHPVDGTDYLYVKCLCYPSQKAQSYTVYICLHKTTGEIYSAKCACVAG